MTGNAIRKIILKQAKMAHVGHIGSALSIADIIAALYAGALNIPSVDDVDRDRFVLSKGHAALAMYAAFFLRGWLTQDDLNTYCTDDTNLGVHPEHQLAGVEFSTGSLGQGLSMAVGTALAAKMKDKKYRTVALLSDAECNEGSVWEAVMFAAQHKLSNLVAIIDSNSQQALNFTKEVINMTPLSERFRAFNWNVIEVNGHSINEITRAVEATSDDNDKPSVIIANTTFGKGVSYMENKIKWHYWPMNDEEYATALKDIEVKK